MLFWLFEVYSPQFFLSLSSLSAIISPFNLLSWSGVFFSLLCVRDFYGSYWVLRGHIRETLSWRAGGICVYPKGPHASSPFPSTVFVCFPVPTQGSSWKDKSVPHSPLCTSQRQRLSVQRLYFKKQNIILLPQGWRRISPLKKEKHFLYVCWVAKHRSCQHCVILT